MISPRNVIAALALAASLSEPAKALCMYKGELYAKTTIPQEFSDSRWVIKARVTAAENHRQTGKDEDPWILYHLRVVADFKGHRSGNIEMFTYRDSGGFYLDSGREYLLFLDPAESDPDAPAAARRASEVNYNCGQSREWSKVSASDRSLLIALASGESVTDKPRAIR